MRPVLRMIKPILLLCCAASFGLAASDTWEESIESQRNAGDRARKWLLKAQNKDGSWGLDANTPGDITCTALAGMSLLAGGSTEREGDAANMRAIRGAVHYILGQAKKARDDISQGERNLIQGKLGFRIHNFSAVIFLTQIYGMRADGISPETNEDLKITIERLTEIIAKSQEPDGSWHKETFGSLKATGMAWLALRSASSTHIPIRQAAVDRTVKFIKQQYNPGTKQYDSGGRMGQYQAIYSTATCIRVLCGMGEAGEKQVGDSIDTFITGVKPGGQWANIYLTVEGEDYLSAMMMTHALIQKSDERWKRWFSFIRESLCKRQNADGSWVTTACINGRTFPTACALLTLESPNRLLPVQQ